MKSEGQAPVPSIRGAYVGPSKGWIIKAYGQEIFDKAVASLPRDQQASYSGEIVSVRWYPIKEWTALLDVVRKEVKAKTGENEATFDRRNLFESISVTMTKVYRFAFGLFDATSIVSKVQLFFKRVYSHGVYEVITNEPGHCVLRFRDAPVEMLPELQRSFPLAASWMLDMAGQEVVRHQLTPALNGQMFSCDLDIQYQKKTKKG